MDIGRKIKKQKQPKQFTAKMQAKLLLVFCVVLACIAFLAIRLVYINKADGEAYKKRVLEQQSYVSSTIPYQRGTIYDSNGLVLAKSEKVFNIILDCKVFLTSEYYYKPSMDALCSVFGFTEDEIKAILEDKPDSQYYILKKGETVTNVLAYEELASKNKYIKGVWFEEEYVRTYPYDSLASRIIGFTNSGNVGTWGVEEYYNDILNGTNGRSYGYYDSELNLQKVTKDAQDGSSLVLTIDATIQALVEKHVSNFLQNTECNNIGVLVMNPNNGEIVAMTSNQEYNLNDPRNLSAWFTEEELAVMTDEEKYNKLNAIWRNFCISDTYEPGSTFKPYTIAAALEENLIEPDQDFYCQGYEIKGGWTIYCNNKSGHGWLTLTEALMKSCNCALMAIADLEGRDLFKVYQESFGFGAKTGIDLPGESSGILMSLDALNETELATSSFGQSFNVSMIQMASAFSSLVNGGYYYQPHVVKEIQSDDGAIVTIVDPILVRETVTKETSDFLLDAFYQTVEAGTAVHAQVEGYLIGGKTGTAQKLPRADKKYVVSFIGVVPVDDPQYIIYTVIDAPEDETYFGSSYFATTLTSEILEDILPHLGIYPEGEINYHVDYPQDETTTETDELNNDAVPETTTGV